MAILRRFGPFILLLSFLRPVERTMHKAQRTMAMAMATLVVALIALVIIAVAAVLWIIAFLQGGSTVV